MTKHLWKDGIRGGLSCEPNPLGWTRHDNLQWRHDWTGHGKSTAAPSSLCLRNSESNQCNSFTMTLLFAWITQNRRTAQWNIYIGMYNIPIYICIYDNERVERTKAIICNPKHIFSSATTRTILNVEPVSCNQCDQITLHPFCRQLFAGHMCSKWFY